MKTYSLSLSTLIQSTNQNISLIDKTNLASVKWFVNWGQFFNYEDYNKPCRVKARMCTKKSTAIAMGYDENLGFLTCSLPSTNCNMINGSVLGQTLLYTSGTNSYLYVDTLQEGGLQSMIPSQAGELMVNFMSMTGASQGNIPDFIITFVFEIDE